MNDLSQNTLVSIRPFIGSRYALLILIGSIILAYAALKWYDEPVRKWLQKKIA